MFPRLHYVGSQVLAERDQTGSNTDWYCPADQYGCLHGDSAPQGQWVNRMMTLGTSQIAGKTIIQSVLENLYGPAGDYDVRVADMTITSLDGTVTTLLGRNATSSAGNGTYACGAVNAPAVWPTNCATQLAWNPGGTADQQAIIFTLGDHLGSASQEFTYGGWMTASTQFMPFGGEINPQGTTDSHYKFTGKERDAESGLDYFGARYYASSMGRWMSPDWSSKPDPIPYAVRQDPQSLNLYSYVSNNPLRRRDPDGHHQECAPDTSSTGKDGVLTVTAGACHEVPDWWQFKGVRSWLGQHPKTVKTVSYGVMGVTAISGVFDGGASELALPEELALEEALLEGGAAEGEAAASAEVGEAAAQAPKTLQTGGNSLSNGTAKGLNDRAELKQARMG